ncbi:MAG TPA: hypothetical protein DCX06_12535 [Opitutae bacterium]|nr:hypothetical protein [Opitutae bacterium]
MNETTTVDKEALTILELTDHDLMAALKVAENQLNIIYTRAQVLMSLAGMVVTVTGFSGRLIASSSLAAQLFLVSGLFVTLASVIWVFLRIMRVRWVTILATQNKDTALQCALNHRNRKTKAYKIGGVILCLGLILYSISIALMLMNPTPVIGPVR